MVAVNPGEQYGVSPTPDPEYTSYRWSRTIPEPGYNKSGEILAKGLGGALAEGVEGLNKYYEERAGEAARTAKGQADDAVIGDLQKAVDMARGNKTASNDALSAYAMAGTETQGASKLDLLSTGNEKVLPADVKDSARVAQNLEAARANGTYSKSYGDMVKASYLKNVRNQYPGYRRIVDSNFGDPANDMISSLLGDLNSYAKMANDSHKEVKSMLAAEVKEGTFGADIMATKLDEGSVTPAQVYKFVNQANADKYKARIAKNELTALEDNDKRRGIVAEHAAQVTADSDVSNFMNTLSIVSNTGDAVGINKALEDVRKGNFDTQHSIEGGMQLQTAVQQLRLKLDKDMHEIDPKTGKSIAMDMKEEGVQKLIAERLKPLNAYVDLFMNHEHSLAFHTKMVTEGVLNDAAKDAYENPDIGAQLVKGKILRETLGPAIEPWMSTLYSDAGDLATKTQHWYLDKATGVAAGDPKADPNTPEAIKSVNDTLTKVQKDRTLNKEGPQLAKKVLGWQNNILDKELPLDVRAKYADAFFKDAGLLDRFAPSRQVSRGYRITGQMDIYQGFGTTQMATTMKELDGAQPGVFDKYRKFMEESFGLPNRGLFANHVRALNDTVQDPTVIPSYNSDTNEFKVFSRPLPAYGPTSKQFRQTPGGFGGTGFEQADLHKAQNIVNEINTGIKALKNVEGQAGVEDMNAMIFQMLTRMGGEVQKGSFSEKMINAMIQANTKPEAERKGPQ